MELVCPCEFEDFFVLREGHPWKGTEQTENPIAFGQVAARQFSDDERMTEYACVVQQTGKAVVAASQMINPDRRVHQRHLFCTLLGFRLPENGVVEWA